MKPTIQKSTESPQPVKQPLHQLDAATSDDDQPQNFFSLANLQSLSEPQTPTTGSSLHDIPATDDEPSGLADIRDMSRLIASDTALEEDMDDILSLSAGSHASMPIIDQPAMHPALKFGIPAGLVVFLSRHHRTRRGATPHALPR